MKNEFVLMGMRIKELRKQKKLSQEELGDLIGVTKVSVCGYEKGTRTPGLDTLDDLAKELDTTIAYLMGEDIKTKDNKIISEKDVKLINDIKKQPKLYKSLIKSNDRFVLTLLKKMERYL